jgi:uncharacterized membrane protein YeaQ/YmgE (transglycosylase-associated protein family)
MGILGWIVLGLIAGAIARAVLKDNLRGGWLASLVLGVIGALVGGYVGSKLFNIGLGDFWSIKTWLVAIIGSIVVLWIYTAVTGRRRR